MAGRVPCGLLESRPGLQRHLPPPGQRRAGPTGRNRLSKRFHSGTRRRADPARSQSPLPPACPFQGALLTAATRGPPGWRTAVQGGDLLNPRRLMNLAGREPRRLRRPSVVASAKYLLLFLIPYLLLPLPIMPDISKAKFCYKQLACVRDLGSCAACQDTGCGRKGCP